MSGHFIDTSIYRVLDFERTSNAQPSLDGVVTRATVGATYTDPSLTQIYGDTKLAGLLFGAYLVTRPLYSPRSHVDNFLMATAGKVLDYAPVIDVERADGMSKAAVTAHLVAVYQELWNRTGREPVIYSGAWFLNSYVDMTHPVLQAAKWWLASYPGITTFDSAENNVDLLVMPIHLKATQVVAWQFASTLAPVFLQTGQEYSCDGNLGFSFGFEQDFASIPPVDPDDPMATNVTTLYSLFFRSGAGTNFMKVGGTAANQKFRVQKLVSVPSASQGKYDMWAQLTVENSPVPAFIAVELYFADGTKKTYSVLE